MPKPRQVVLIGYSGHAYVVVDIFQSQNIEVVGYYELDKKTSNPYKLTYYGNEGNVTNLERIKSYKHFVAIGDNTIRKRTLERIESIIHQKATNAIHKSAFISSTAILGDGIMIGGNAQINAMSQISDGVICNTACIIEHECNIAAYAHIAPGAVLCGNVRVGENSFIGAGAVVKEGTVIGDNVIIGAGAVIISDIPNNKRVVGNPQRFI